MYRINATALIRLDCEKSGDTVQLVHQGTTINDPAIIVFRSDESTTIEIRDFEDQNGHCRINAFTVERDGTLTPWERAATGAVSPAIRTVIVPGSEREALLVPVPYAPLGALTADLVDAFEPEDYVPSRVRIVLPPPEDDKPPPHGDR